MTYELDPSRSADTGDTGAGVDRLNEMSPAERLTCALNRKFEGTPPELFSSHRPYEQSLSLESRDQFPGTTSYAGIGISRTAPGQEADAARMYGKTHDPQVEVSDYLGLHGVGGANDISSISMRDGQVICEGRVYPPAASWRYPEHGTVIRRQPEVLGDIQVEEIIQWIDSASVRDLAAERRAMDARPLDTYIS